MQYLMIVDTDAHVTTLVGFVAVESAHAAESAVGRDGHLFHAGESDTRSCGRSLLGFTVAAGIQESVLAKSGGRTFSDTCSNFATMPDPATIYSPSAKRMTIAA